MKKTVKLVSLVTVLALALAIVGTAMAEANWPNGTISLIVPYSAGSSSDNCARPLATALSKVLGVTVIVEDLPGSSGWIGWTEGLKRDKDGNTLMLTNTATVFAHYSEANPREESYEDFVWLANGVTDNCVVAIRKGEDRFTDFASLIEYSKENELLIAAMSGDMTSNDYSTSKAFEKQYGVNFIMVPVDAGNDAMAMFISGNTDIFFGNVGDIMGQLDNLTPIAVLSSERDSLIPDCPTSDEVGFNFKCASYRGYSFAKGVDEEIVAKMTAALEQAMADPEYLETEAKIGMVVDPVFGKEYEQTLVDLIDARLELFDIAK